LIENLDWEQQAVLLANTGVMSWRQISKVLKVPKSTLSDFLREYKGFKEDAEVIVQEHDNSRILFISDMHVPYHHPNTVPFLKMLKDRYSPTRIICLGDEVDKHGLSFHGSRIGIPHLDLTSILVDQL